MLTNTLIRNLLFRFFMILYISFLCLVPLSVIAFPDKDDKQLQVKGIQPFRFNPNARSGSGAAANELLQLLADGSGKLRVFIEYDLHYHFAVSIGSEDDGTIQLIFESAYYHIAGDTMYKDFSIRRSLLPPLMNITLHVLGNQEKVVEEVSFADIPWPPSEDINNMDFSVKVNQNIMKDGFSMEVKNVEFHYGMSYAREISSLRRALKAYYSAPDILSDVKQNIEPLRDVSFETVILNEFRLCDAEDLFFKIDYHFIHTQLDLDLYDPECFSEQYFEVLNQMMALRESFNFTLSHIDSLIFDHAKVFMENGDTLKASEMWARVLVYNPVHIPSQLGLASLEYHQGDVQKSLLRLENLLKDAPAPEKWRHNLTAFTSETFDSEIIRATIFVEEGRFLEALNLLNTLENFCNQISYWQCPGILYDKIGEVHYGMFRSYLSVARRALRSNNFSFALDYVESALEYRRQNMAYVAEDSEAIELLTSIVDNMYVEAEQQWRNNNFGKSDNLLVTAKEICERFPQVLCREETWTFAEQVQQDKKDAEKITVEIVVSEPSVFLPDMSVDEARESIAGLISKAHLKAWAGETDQARQLLNEILPFAMKYDLRKDTIINARIVSISEMIVDRECEMGLRNLNEHIAKTKEYFKNGWYDDAFRSYQLAKSIQQDLAYCEDDQHEILESLNYVEVTARYYRKLQTAQAAYFESGRGKFEDFIYHYDQSVEFYHTNNLAQWDVKHQSLYTFTVSSGNTSLMRAIIPVLAERGEAEESFALLKLLQEQGFDAREMKEIMEHAAKNAAKYLHAVDPSIHPRHHVREKTNRDKWFRNYERSFIKHWPQN